MKTARSGRRRSDFTPPRCPRPSCHAHDPVHPFRWRRKGSFLRRCDGRHVQRFLCLICGRHFSTQTFSLDYRLKRPDLLVPIFASLASKSSLRRISRELHVSRELVEHRLELLGAHCQRYHEQRLEELAADGGLVGPFLMDELETFETDRKLKPVTVPVLIEAEAWFILHAETAPMAPRGRRTAAENRRLEKIEAVEGKRRSGSTRAVRSTFDVLAKVVRKEGDVRVRTDRKPTYATALHRLFGKRLKHVRVDSGQHRGPRNPLFPINHTLARLRDLVSRLVRRSWCASKIRARLERHLWVVIGFRNYVDGWRSEPAWKQATSAAARLGIGYGKLAPERFLRWRDPLVV